MIVTLLSLALAQVPAQISQPAEAQAPTGEGFAMRGPAPVELELAGMVGTRVGIWTPAGTLRAQLPIGRIAFLRGDLTARQGLNDGLWPVRWQMPVELAGPIRTAESWGRLAAGPLWTRPGGATLGLGAGVVGGVARLNDAPTARMRAEGLDVGPRTFGVGGAVGAFGSHPVIRGTGLELAWDGWFHRHLDISEVDRSQQSRDAAGGAAGPGTAVRSPVLSAAVRYRPGPAGPWVALGGRAEWASRPEGFVAPYGIAAASLSVGWTAVRPGQSPR